MQHCLPLFFFFYVDFSVLIARGVPFCKMRDVCLEKHIWKQLLSCCLLWFLWRPEVQPCVLAVVGSLSVLPPRWEAHCQWKAPWKTPGSRAVDPWLVRFCWSVCVLVCRSDLYVHDWTVGCFHNRGLYSNTVGLLLTSSGCLLGLSGVASWFSWGAKTQACP